MSLSKAQQDRLARTLIEQLRAQYAAWLALRNASFERTKQEQVRYLQESLNKGKNAVKTQDTAIHAASAVLGAVGAVASAIPVVGWVIGAVAALTVAMLQLASYLGKAFPVTRTPTAPMPAYEGVAAHRGFSMQAYEELAGYGWGARTWPDNGVSAWGNFAQIVDEWIRSLSQQIGFDLMPYFPALPRGQAFSDSDLMLLPIPEVQDAVDQDAIDREIERQTGGSDPRDPYTNRSAPMPAVAPQGPPTGAEREIGRWFYDHGFAGTSWDIVLSRLDPAVKLTPEMAEKMGMPGATLTPEWGHYVTDYNYGRADGAAGETPQARSRWESYHPGQPWPGGGFAVTQTNTPMAPPQQNGPGGFLNSLLQISLLKSLFGGGGEKKRSSGGSAAKRRALRARLNAEVERRVAQRERERAK